MKNWFGPGFRPLAGKLRAKTHILYKVDQAISPPSFPSPCGEIKGQNLISVIPRASSNSVSVPLRGN